MVVGVKVKNTWTYAQFLKVKDKTIDDFLNDDFDGEKVTCHIPSEYGVNGCEITMTIPKTELRLIHEFVDNVWYDYPDMNPPTFGQYVVRFDGGEERVLEYKWTIEGDPGSHYFVNYFDIPPMLIHNKIVAFKSYTKVYHLNDKTTNVLRFIVKPSEYQRYKKLVEDTYNKTNEAIVVFPKEDTISGLEMKLTFLPSNFICQ